MAASRKKWTERDTVRFVELYEEEQVLWNMRLKDCKQKRCPECAIQCIIHNLNMEATIQEVNTKINNIRSTYTQEKVKIKKSTGTGSGANDVYVPSLAWYEIADRFLSGVIKSRKTYQNVIHIQCDATRQESTQLVVVNDALQEEGIEVQIQRDATSQETSPKFVVDYQYQEAIRSIGGIQNNENYRYFEVVCR
ncbi:unnamed protein product [Parnassius apollo]|uniref:(apollo) hypothetical protein n=1 Tax=Parnassius apollo TaxID=110799 RepID=A0A8S3X7D0_PARAO|nr:unnamed protein product [Parnassius apollo]